MRTILFTDLSQMLYRFWSRFELDGIPIATYRSGHVPDNARLPYVIFDVRMGDYGGAASQTAHVWIRHEPGRNVNRDRAAIADQIASAIPVTGKIVKADHGGGFWISRNGIFLSDYDPEATDPKPEGEPVIGLRVDYLIKAF